MKRILFLILGITAGNLLASNMQMNKYGVQPAWENPMQNMGKGQSKPGYAEMDWSADKILKVRLRDSMVTIINFPQWETIRDAYIGDSDFFDGRPVSKNVLMLSPTQDHAGADTNMIVFGASGNKYAFYLKSEPLNTDTLTHSIIDVRVPNSKRKGGGFAGGNSVGHSLMGGANYKNNNDFMENQDYSWIKSIPVDPTEFRFDMDIFVPNPDDYVIAPERVWRDQIFTYIDFGEKTLSMTQRPVISILVEGGEAPVGFRTDGPNSRLLIVEAVGDMVLRNGQRLVCIKKREKPFLSSRPHMPQQIIEPAINSADPDGIYFEAEEQGMTSIMSNNFEVQDNFSNPAIKGLTIQGKKQSRGDVLPSHYAPLVRSPAPLVVLELASGNTINELQNVWMELSENEQFNKIIGDFEPFYAIDTNGVDALGQTQYSQNETYRLRVGPITDVERGIELCTKLSSKNLPCSVISVK